MRPQADSSAANTDQPPRLPRIFGIAHVIAAVVIGAPLFIWGVSILLTGEATIYGRHGRTTTLIGSEAIMLGWGLVLSLPAAFSFVRLARIDWLESIARRLGTMLVAAMLLLAVVAMVLHAV